MYIDLWSHIEGTDQAKATLYLFTFQGTILVMIVLRTEDLPRVFPSWGHRFWMSPPFHHHGDRDTEAISFFKKGHPIQRVPGLLSWEIRGMSHSVCPLLRNDFFLWWSFFVRHLDCVCGRVTRYEFAFEYQMAVVLVINFWHWWLNHPNSDLVKPS